MKIFISASSSDFLETNFIKSKLKDFDLNNEITFWYADNENVPVGSDLSDILDNIAESQGAILLISNAFLNSRFITKKELPSILKKRSTDQNYKLIPVLLEKETDFENFDEISLENLKYINSKNTAFKDLAESESYVMCDKIIQALSTKQVQNSSDETTKILKRIDLMSTMINELDKNYELTIDRMVQSFIASGGTSDDYSGSKRRWNENLIRYRNGLDRTKHELMDYKNLNKKLRALDESQYKFMEKTMEQVIKFKIKLDRSIEIACRGWEIFNSKEEAEKVAENYKLPSEAFMCALCKKIHVGLKDSPSEEEFEYEQMINWSDELRDQY